MGTSGQVGLPVGPFESVTGSPGPERPAKGRRVSDGSTGPSAAREDQTALEDPVWHYSGGDRQAHHGGRILPRRVAQLARMIGPDCRVPLQTILSEKGQALGQLVE